VKKIEFHFTPKHASWLNMAEIEFSVMVGQCLKLRIPDMPVLRVNLQLGSNFVIMPRLLLIGNLIFKKLAPS
jgi:hypothetical protein